MLEKNIVLKELSQTLSDEKILKSQKHNIEERIIIKLNTLGLKGSNYSDIVIRISEVRDKYSSVFAEVEQLIKRRNAISKELFTIENTINEVSMIMKDSNLLEYEVFDLRYIKGLTLQEIANKKKYSLDRIKQINANINKKFE